MWWVCGEHVVGMSWACGGYVVVIQYQLQVVITKRGTRIWLPFEVQFKTGVNSTSNKISVKIDKTKGCEPLQSKLQYRTGVQYRAGIQLRTGFIKRHKLEKVVLRTAMLARSQK